MTEMFTRFARREDGWAIAVYNETADLTGTKVEVQRKASAPTRVRLTERIQEASACKPALYEFRKRSKEAA